jgi:hemerythrin-like domain-containing protein
MSTENLETFFVQDHRRCDDAWAALEAAADDGDGPRTVAAWRAFLEAMQGNLRREEEVLFPAFEAATGMRQGPTVVMRMEHEQMRAVLEQMEGVARLGQWAQVIDHGDTLMMLVQQHNMKEEGVLLPMAHRSLAPRWAELQARLR